MVSRRPLLYGSSLIIISDKLQALGLSSSDRDTSIRWCGCSPDLVRDCRRRSGAFARVSPRTVSHLRHRLAAVAQVVAAEIAAELQKLDADIMRDVRVYELLGRRYGR